MKLDKIDMKSYPNCKRTGGYAISACRLRQSFAEPLLDAGEEAYAEGFITGYYHPDRCVQAGQTLTIFTEITLKHHQHNDFARFLTAIQKVNSVIECHLVSGGYGSL